MTILASDNSNKSIKMRLANEDLKWTDWLPVQSSWLWTLSSGDGFKTERSINMTILPNSQRTSERTFFIKLKDPYPGYLGIPFVASIKLLPSNIPLLEIEEYNSREKFLRIHLVNPTSYKCETD